MAVMHQHWLQLIDCCLSHTIIIISCTVILYSGRAESVMIEKSVIHESEPVDKSEDSPLMTRDEDSEDDDQRLSSTSKPKVPRVLYIYLKYRIA